MKSYNAKNGYEAGKSEKYCFGVNFEDSGFDPDETYFVTEEDYFRDIFYYLSFKPKWVMDSTIKVGFSDDIIKHYENTATLIKNKDLVSFMKLPKKIQVAALGLEHFPKYANL